MVVVVAFGGDGIGSGVAMGSLEEGIEGVVSFVDEVVVVVVVMDG